MTMKAYNLADPKPRAPIVTYNNVLTVPTAGGSFPPEVSMCVSFKGSTVSGVPQARRRGRVFLPAFKGSAYGSDGQIGTTAINTVKAGISALLSASDAAADWTWCIYSPTSDAMVNVIGGWIDNAPDIQRRRGLSASLRTPWP